MNVLLWANINIGEGSNRILSNPHLHQAPVSFLLYNAQGSYGDKTPTIFSSRPSSSGLGGSDGSGGSSMLIFLLLLLDLDNDDDDHVNCRSWNTMWLTRCWHPVTRGYDPPSRAVVGHVLMSPSDSDVLYLIKNLAHAVLNRQKTLSDSEVKVCSHNNWSGQTLFYDSAWYRIGSLTIQLPVTGTSGSNYFA